LNNTSASRFLSRWLQGDERRPAQLTQWAATALSPAAFDTMLHAELDAGMPLPRAMRRVRNLVVSALIHRDLGGAAQLDEVLSTISDFADFAVHTLLAALDEEMRAQHGAPIGEETGRPLKMIVLGMGKLGGGELNVSSDIDLIFVYPENGETAAGPGQRQLSNQEYFIRLGKKLIGAISEVA
jgi:glutamate-ammonia-ligase adenylyltransferase